MIRKLLEDKYGKFITDTLINDRNEIFRENSNKDGIEEQNEVIKALKKFKDDAGRNLVPDFFWNNKVDWGFDFSSWIGDYNNKDFFFIGAEPHIYNNFQVVYDFGNFKGLTLKETALQHFNRDNDIWSYLTQIFVSDLTLETKTDFLNKCYITDLCHAVPKGCGQVKDICEKLSIKSGDWKKFRSSVAKRFLIKEIQAVNPKYVILHGNASRDFFQSELGLQFTNDYKIQNSIYSIKTGDLNGYKIISIPHLKGDVRNKLWKCLQYPERPESAKKILNEIINNGI